MTNETAPKKSNGKTAIILAAVVALVAGAYAVYSIIGSKSNNQGDEKVVKAERESVTAAPEGVTKALSTGGMQALLIHKTRKAVPEIAFKNGDGKNLSLANWKGRVVLLNLWATWCGPCRKEMPHLAKLQEMLGSDDFEVVALSIDRKGAEASGRFLVEAKATALNLYIDDTSRVLGKLRAPGLPVTILVDRKSREIGRLIGSADWSGKDAVRLIKTALAEK
ncbi:MAG TPA: TlpA family protein disulfide reductase [Rhizobiales bacterium]|nr:TlpA family protein disulfide reductase [Hyphomicrobiales bacterium]